MLIHQRSVQMDSIPTTPRTPSNRILRDQNGHVPGTPMPETPSSGRGFGFRSPPPPPAPTTYDSSFVQEEEGEEEGAPENEEVCQDYGYDFSESDGKENVSFSVASGFSSRVSSRIIYRDRIREEQRTPSSVLTSVNTSRQESPERSVLTSGVGGLGQNEVADLNTSHDTSSAGVREYFNNAAAAAAQRGPVPPAHNFTPSSLTSPSGTVIGSQGSIHSAVLRRRVRQHEQIDSQEQDQLKENVLALVWAAGKLGAAYYEIETSELFLLPDIAEAAPDFSILNILFKQVMPRYVIVSSRQDERLIVCLRNLCGQNLIENQDQNDVHQDQDSATPQLFIQTGREFAPDSCKQRVLSMRIATEPKNHDAREHLIFINSLIPFSNEIMVRATGALLKFLDKSGIELLQLDLVDGQIPILSVNICTMNDLVLVDHTAWSSLQIFSLEYHPAGTKQGKGVAAKEGLSVYGHLNRCSTTQGSKFLRLQLLRPTRDKALLKRRYDAIEYCADSVNIDFVQGACNCLKSIKSIPKLLFKMTTLHASVKDWKDFYQTIYHCLLLGELCSTKPQSIQVFSDITNMCKSATLRVLSQEIIRVVDFEESTQRNRFAAKSGIDPELDKKKAQYSCLPEVMSMVASEEMASLPQHVQQCSVVYIPEVGYLLSVTLWNENLRNEDLQIPGLEYKFTSHNLAYYKSARMKELDIILGDCLIAILDRETSIMLHMTENILKHAPFLTKIGHLASELDSLNSVAAVARDNNYVRPQIVEGHEKLEIISGRHPLVEILCDFVPNSTVFSSNERVQILTGPNASGKSIYLKQVGTIVIMALSGCFVPAASAIIPAYDRICTRIHALESVSTGLSTFMIDINHMSLALRTGTKNSLIIVDEFGKGTAEADGVALLVATIEDFINREQECPTIFLSTHYYSLMKYLAHSSLLKFQTMEYMKEGNRIIYLFRLRSGSCLSSFAHLVAEEAGISETTIKRSLEMEELVRNQLGEDEIIPVPYDSIKEDLMLQLTHEFLTLDFDTVDPIEYLRRIGSYFDQDEHSRSRRDANVSNLPTTTTSAPPIPPSTIDD